MYWLLMTSSYLLVDQVICYTREQTEIQKNATQLLNQLLSGYDNRQRPGFNGPPTVIRADLNIRSMGPISEADMTYSMDAYFRQTWDDERLKLSGEYSVMAVHISMLEKIWKPDTYFSNSVMAQLHTITEPNKLLRIMKNGTILYSTRLTIKASCPMYLHYFPGDEQSCPLQFGSFAFTKEQVVYVWKFGAENSIKIDSNMRLSQFDLIGTPAWNETKRNKFGEFSMLKVTFRLSRHMGYFLINVYVPCILIVVLSWVSFWLNREATADRIGLGITTVLTLTTTSMDTRTDLPKVHYATALDWFVIICFGFVIGTLLQFAGVHYFTKIGSGEFEDHSDDEDKNVKGKEEEEEEGEKRLMWITSDKVDLENRYKTYPPLNRKNIYTKSSRHMSHLPQYTSRRRHSVQRAPTSTGRGERGPGSHTSPRYPPRPPSSEALRPRDPASLRLLRCLQGDEEYRRILRRSARESGVNSVSQIDKISRVIFPLAFLVINLIYWIGYARDPNHARR